MNVHEFYEAGRVAFRCADAWRVRACLSIASEMKERADESAIGGCARFDVNRWQVCEPSRLFRVWITRDLHISERYNWQPPLNLLPKQAFPFDDI